MKACSRHTRMLRDPQRLQDIPPAALPGFVRAYSSTVGKPRRVSANAISPNQEKTKQATVHAHFERFSFPDQRKAK